MFRFIRRTVLAAVFMTSAGSVSAQVTFASAQDLCNQPTLPVGATLEVLEWQQLVSRARLTRFACVVHPASVPTSGPLRSVIVLHGGNGNARALMQLNKEITEQANANNMLAVFAQGTPIPGCNQAKPCIENKWSGNITIPGAGLRDKRALNDTYIRELARRVVADHGGSADQIFLLGFSGGAKHIYSMLAHDLTAGHNAFTPRGVATAAGLLIQFGVGEDTTGQGGGLGGGLLGAGSLGTFAEERTGGIVELWDGAPAVPILMVQGLADTRMPTEGGFADGQGFLRNGWQFKVDAARALNGAFDAAVITTLPPTPAGESVLSYTYGGGDATVQAVTIEGHGHSWPNHFSDDTFDFFDAQ